MKFIATISIGAFVVMTTVGCAHADQTTAKLSRAPFVQSTTTNSAYLVWQTSRPASTLVEYRAVGDSRWQRPISNIVRKQQHVVQLRGLKAGARYFYRVKDNGRTLATGILQSDKSSGAPFRFALWGDSGVGSSGQKKLARQIDRARPDALIHTGDLIYPKGEWELYDPYFFSIYRPTLSRVPFYGSIGNHETYTEDARPWLQNFVMPRNGPRGLTPERNYSFDYADAHVAVLDSNLSRRALQSKIAPWLERDMKASRKIWKFVVFHHPPLSSGLHGDEARTHALMPLFARLKIDIVFNGHDHTYERFQKQNGVTYIVTGAGGAPLYPRKNPRRETVKWKNDVHSFTQIDIRKRTLKAQQIDANGLVIDTWSLNK